jgi:hypothetical protein
VFIVGLPRSGTTLTEQILASHPQVHGAGELRLAGEAFKSLPGVQCARRAALGPDDAQNFWPPESVRQLQPADVEYCARRHLERLTGLNPRALRVVDKLPDNYLYLGWIASMFPQARIIHCRRDLRDTALSCWMTNFKSVRWACDPGEIGHRCGEYRRLMEHWRRQLPISFLEIDYEETVADLEGVARRLIAWIGLEWDPACLNFHQTQRPVRTASVSQVRQPVYSKSVGRWSNYAPFLPELFGPLKGIESAAQLP